jgi:hypothetical protein
MRNRIDRIGRRCHDVSPATTSHPFVRIARSVSDIPGTEEAVCVSMLAAGVVLEQAEWGEEETP